MEKYGDSDSESLAQKSLQLFSFRKIDTCLQGENDNFL